MDDQFQNFSFRVLEFWFRLFLIIQNLYLHYVSKTDDSLKSTSINQARYTCLTPSCTFLVQGTMFSHRRYELEDYRLTFLIYPIHSSISTILYERYLDFSYGMSLFLPR